MLTDNPTNKRSLGRPVTIYPEFHVSLHCRACVFKYLGILKVDEKREK